MDERKPVEEGEVDVDIEGGVDMSVDEAGRTSKRVDGDGAATSRTREYRVVGVVRKKVVFALR